MEQERDIFMMSRKEIKRYQVIRKVLDKQIKQKEVAEYFGISPRQVRRIVKRVKEYGEQGVIHQLRGKGGNRKTDSSFKQKVLGLYRKNYWDFGATLATEKLLECDGIKVCDETLRLWLIKEGLREHHKRSALKERSRRERKEHLGQMIQMDGSHHDWLEGRGPKIVLMGFIDDATSRFYGRFYDHEGTMPAMDGLKGYIKRYGLPGSIYLDKHSTYKNNRKHTYADWSFRDQEAVTQFGRACKQLGIEVIFAHSPQNQILSKTRAQWVTVYEYLNGQTAIKYGKDKLLFKPIGKPQPKLRVPIERRFKRRPKHIEPQNSWWRNGFKLTGSLPNKSGHFGVDPSGWTAK